MTMTFIQGATKIKSRASQLNKTAGTYANNLHTVLCSAMNHALHTKDTRIVDDVYDLIHKSTSLNSVDAWIRKYSNLSRRKNEAGVMVYKYPKKTADNKVNVMVWNVEAACAEPFYALTSEETGNKEQVFDLEGRFVSFILAAARKADKGALKDKERNVAHLEAFLKLANERKIDLTKYNEYVKERDAEATAPKEVIPVAATM